MFNFFYSVCFEAERK